MQKLMLLAAVAMLATCRPVEENQTPVTEYKPLFLSRGELEKSVGFEPARKMESPGKIYYKDQFIYISEPGQGIHVINNADPKNPVNTGFIKVAGCTDMAIKQNVLYVNNAVDIIGVDLTNPTPTVLSRAVGVFPEPTPPDGKSVPTDYAIDKRPTSDMILVGWYK